MKDWIKRMFGIDRSRRFQLRGGFLDGTRYIRINEDGRSFIVPPSKPPYETYEYDLEYCLDQVRNGQWIELKAWQ